MVWVLGDIALGVSNIVSDIECNTCHEHRHVLTRQRVGRT